ncbi:Hypothetical protein NTJ_00938 [Nesidiocoris tenuis]|uniref:Uncharacterized protein n=1 Tax=Nesidiocoris tenuis TaxID=355587 RepID=A0ABN7AD00_9HEMI|nr:Hypothetical protein NTJ_00938 [Nesidiocoris tenuis]
MGQWLRGTSSGASPRRPGGARLSLRFAPVKYSSGFPALFSPSPAPHDPLHRNPKPKPWSAAFDANRHPSLIISSPPNGREF